MKRGRGGRAFRNVLGEHPAGAQDRHWPRRGTATPEGCSGKDRVMPYDTYPHRGGGGGGTRRRRPCTPGEDAEAGSGAGQERPVRQAGRNPALPQTRQRPGPSMCGPSEKLLVLRHAAACCGMLLPAHVGTYASVGN